MLISLCADHYSHGIALGALFSATLANKLIKILPPSPPATLYPSLWNFKETQNTYKLLFASEKCNFTLTSLLCLFLSQTAALQLSTKELSSFAHKKLILIIHNNSREMFKCKETAYVVAPPPYSPVCIFAECTVSVFHQILS